MLTKRLLTYIGLTLFGVYSAWGQENYFANYSVEYGLNTTFTTSITQDAHGFIWVSTAGGGINKFNGLNFSSFTRRHGLKSNIIYQVDCDSQNYIWALSDSTLIKMRGSELVYIEVDSSRTDRRYRLFLDASDNAWVATERGGVYKISEGKSVHYDTLQGFTGSHVRDIYQRKDQSLIFSTTKGLFSYINGRFDSFNVGGIGEAEIMNFFEDSEGNFWLSTSDGLRFQKYGTDTLRDFEGIKALEGRHVYMIAQDKEGKIWMGTSRGVVLFHDGSFKKFDEEEGFINNEVNDIYIDNHGNAWFSTWGFGLYQYRRTPFIVYDKRFGLHHQIIKGILVDSKENIWFGLHANGIDKYDGKVITNYSIESGHLPHNKISTILEDHQGNMWFGTRGGGVLKFANGGFKVYNKANSGLSNNDIYSSLEDSNRNLWIGTLHGLSLYANGSFKSFPKPEEKGLFPVMSIREMPDGRILVGSTLGLYIVAGEELKEFGSELGLPNYPVHSTTIKDSILWLGTWGNGILRIDLATHATSFITEDDGLDSDLIYSVRFDPKGDLWVGSSLGLTKLTFGKDNNIEQLRKYTSSDGFNGRSLSSERSIYIANDSSIWISTMNGAYRYVRENDAIDKQPPLTHVTSLKLFNMDSEWASNSAIDSWFNLPDNLELKYDENHLTFNFIGLSYFDPQNVSYSFKLDNFDAEWSPATRNTFATYSNLPPGDYVFNVKAGNGEGIWNKTSATYSLTILPAFWQTWWFYVLCTANAIGLGTYLWNNYKTQNELNKRLSINEAKELAILETRKKMALEFQHEIGNKLASILVSSNVLQKKLELSNNGEMSFARKIEANSKSLFDDIKDFIWTIDPNNDNLAQLYNYIKEYGEKRFTGDSQFFSNVNLMTMQPDLVDSNLNRQIVWIFKKMVNLTSGDDSCKYASLDVEQHPGYFEITYCFDNNTEISEDKSLIREMEKRARKVQGEVNLGTCPTDQKLTQISFTSNRATNGTIQK